MTITLHIEAESPEQLQQAIKGLAHRLTTGNTTIINPSAPEEPTPRKTRKTKETPAKESEPIEEQPVLDLKEEPQEDEKPKETPEPPKVDPEVPLDEPIPTVVDLRAIAAEKGQADAANKPKIRALLDTYDCKSLSAVPEDKRIAFKADLEAL